LRSRDLLRKEVAELLAARSFWLLLILAGLLCGQSFIDAVSAYADASAPGALAQGLSPLEGILTPTLGAYDLAITLLFPFVAIRLVAAEKSSDALKLMLQWPVRLGTQIAAKVAALLLAWLVSLIPFALALALWRGYGGHLYAPEIVNLMAGYTLRFLLTASLAMAAAALMPGAANAAIVVLGFTIGTWALDFMATGRGGLLQTLASYTPAAMLRGFERGLFRADVALVIVALSVLGFALTAIWLQLRPVRRTVIACAIAAIAVVAAAQVRTSFDLSENRRNSLPRADAAALAAIHEPLDITVYLAAEDPRMNDFANDVLVKLRRAVPRLRVHYPFAGRTGLFDNDPRYGEVHYRLGAHTAVNRSSTEEIVLETIYGLAGAGVPRREESSYPGYPLRHAPGGAAAVFYLLWPLAVLGLNRMARRS
jgi:ABC-type transport system involved in multi-copper enzyme maturation permease subunit